MNLNKPLIYILFILMTGFTACEKSEITGFSAEPAINFEYFLEYRDRTPKKEINYSFLTNPGGETVVEIPVIVTGDTVNYDRVFKVEVVEDTIAMAQPDQYEIMETTVRAGQFVDTLRVRLKSSPALDDKTVGIKLRLVESPEFKPGLIERRDFLVTWTNKVVVPTWGVYFRTFFTSVGSSQAYRIFVETTGFTDFQRAEYGTVSQSGAVALGTAFGDYIMQYNKDHKNDPDPSKRVLLHDDGSSAGQPIVPVYYTHSKFPNQ